jgi:hypothetical protein
VTSRRFRRDAVTAKFFWFCAAGCLASAQSPGTFTPTGSLTIEREGHTATLLTNGKVLIVGGGSTSTGLHSFASAELYDPSTRAFTPAGSMRTARSSHTATLLPSGKVLVAGGSPGANGGILSSAEIYDPTAGTFTDTGNMTAARYGHSATLLNTGRVLIAGGCIPVNFGSCASSSVELYDLQTGTFQATGNMISTRSGHSATLLPNGKVLFAGGRSGTDTSASSEVYDPVTGTFSATGPSAYPDYLFPTSSGVLTNGKVLATLEYSCDPAEYAELYDPPTETFTATGKQTAEFFFGTGTLLPEGKMLITGGDFPGSAGAGDAELFDPANGTFTAAGATTSRGGHTATLLPDGTVLLAGGWLCCGYSVNTAEIYHPAVLLPSPVLLSDSASGRAAILHGSNQQLVSPDNPALAEEALEIFGTGLVDGSVIPPQVSMGGKLAEVLFFGNAPGFPGLNQINVRVPSSLGSGSAVPVWLHYLSRPSNQVTLVVQ